MAQQVGSSVYSASVVCLLCILILLSSERDLILVGKRTPKALVLGGDERYVTNNSPNVRIVRQEEVGFVPATDQGETFVLEISIVIIFLEVCFVYLSVYYRY